MPEQRGDTVNLDDRAPRHARSFRQTALAGIAYQGVVSVYQLLILAIVARRFEAQILGLWLTAYSLFGLAQAANLGVPGALLSRVDSRESISPANNAIYVRSALVLTSWYVAIPLILAFLTPFLPLRRFLTFPPGAGAPAPFVATLLLFLVFTLLASLTQPLYMALHRGHQSYVVTSLVYLAWIPCVLFGNWLQAPFAIMAGLFLGPPLLSGAVLWAIGLKRGYLAIAKKAVPGASRDLWRVGAPFLAIDLATSIILRTPEAIISRSRDLSEAARFSVIQRFPILLSAVLIVVLQPLWPFLATAARTNDHRKAQGLMVRALKSALLLWAVFAAVVLFAGGALVLRWLGTDLQTTPATLPLAVGLGLAQSAHHCVSLMLVGLAARRENMRISAIMLLAYVPACFLLSAEFGAPGAFAALIMVFGLVGAPLGLIEVRRKLKRMGAVVEQVG